MEKKILKLEDTKVTRSFADAINDWREGADGLTYHEYMTCLSFLAFTMAQDIISNTGMVVKEMKDRVLDEMHAYLQMAGDSALGSLLEEIRDGEEKADAAEVSEAEESQEDNGYFEKFEDD